MYAHLEERDNALQAQEKNQPALNVHFIVKFWIIGAVVTYFSFIIFKTLDVVYLILAAFVISMVMNAPITFFSKYMPKWLALTLSYLIILAVAFIIIVFVIPFILSQIAEVIRIAIIKINELQDLLKTQGLENVVHDYLYLPAMVKDYLIKIIHSWALASTLQNNILDNMSQIISAGTSYATNLGSFAVKLVTGVFTTLFQAIILFCLSIFFSLEKEQVINFISSLAWSHRNHTYVKLQRMYAKLGLWLKGQLFVCLYVGILVGLSCVLISWIFHIHIPNIGSIALLAWITNLAPYVGPLVGIITAVVVTLIAGWWKAALLVLICYVFVNQSENNVFTPIIMNKTLGVSALLVFICMLLWGLVFGFIGVLLAVPISVIITMVFDKEETK